MVKYKTIIIMVVYENSRKKQNKNYLYFGTSSHNIISVFANDRQFPNCYKHNAWQIVQEN